MAEEIRKYHQPSTRGTWVQTERAGHEAWAQLIDQSPRAAQLMHVLVANMDERGALVASQATLAKLTKVSVATIKRALTALIKGQWIQTIRIGGERGGTLAYVVNSRVAWADSRDNLKLAYFNARVLVSSEDQEDLGDEPLQKLPIMETGDLQLPAGEGIKPPAQELLIVPNLPMIQKQGHE